MPTLILKVTPPQTPARHRALAQALTALTAQLLGKRREVTAVLIESLPAEHWYVGGDAVQRPTALLEISITAGTNTAEEKAAFVSAAFAELQRQLGEGGALEEARRGGAGTAGHRLGLWRANPEGAASGAAGRAGMSAPSARGADQAARRSASRPAPRNTSTSAAGSAGSCLPRQTTCWSARHSTRACR